MAETINHALPEYLAARQTAQRRDRWVRIGAIVLAIASFVSAGYLLDPINEIRKDKQLVIDPTTIKGLPADIALLGKMGPARALVIDWASIRAERLKDEGKTYEAMQLHRIVCALQPRYPKVWAYAAWNMAYNISVMKYSPEERWQWVQNGIKLIRDEGLQYNPKSVTLYKELAWIYWHKIGDFLDDEHFNYKRAHAVQMERVLGAPPITQTKEEYYDWFRKIVDAPRDLDGMLQTDTEVRALADELEALDLPTGDTLLDFVARYIRPELRIDELLADPEVRNALHGRRLQLLSRENSAPALDRLLAALRSQVLRDEMKFDLDWMLELMVEHFGPLDWRSPFSHPLYWASYGDMISRGQKTMDPADSMNTARLVFMSLQNSITRGRVILEPDFDDPFESYIELTPDTRFIPYMYDVYMYYAEDQFGESAKYQREEEKKEGMGIRGTSYWPGFIANMHNWIQALYFEGGERNLEQAENYFVYLHDNNPHPDGRTQEQYDQTLDEWIKGTLFEQLQTYKQAEIIVRSFIQKSLKQLSLGLDQPSLRSLQFARVCYDEWMGETTIDINDRRKMQQFRKIRWDAIDGFMRDIRLVPLAKHRLWKRLDIDGRGFTYDRLKPYFDDLCAAQDPPWSVARAFAEPPGMEQYRSFEIETRGGARQEGIEQGERHNN
ncbi:MAG: hypothetical protein IID36_06560 [Planctomycetes bacterium]|nr:hypothetical protein [Planctomycetota bacterium]